MKKSNRKKILIRLENSVLKSNELSLASFSPGLTMNQMQLMMYAIYCTQATDTTAFTKVSFESKFDRRYNTADAVEDALALLGLKFGLLEEKKDKFKFYNVFQYIGYERGDFQFQWSEKILPHILELKDTGKYILNDFDISKMFKSTYSWILYDNLKARYGQSTLSLTKEEWLTMFNVAETKSYVNNTSIFKRKVLDVAVAELNDHTELNVSYTERKKGKAIVGFDVHWSRGELIYYATDKQVNYLQTLIDEAKANSIIYVNLGNTELRAQAIALLKNVEELEKYTQSPSLLTTEEMSDKINEAKECIRKLNAIVEDDGVAGIQVPLFNWLEE